MTTKKTFLFGTLVRAVFYIAPYPVNCWTHGRPVFRSIKLLNMLSTIRCTQLTLHVVCYSYNLVDLYMYVFSTIILYDIISNFVKTSF
jgi:hypothetical protein